MFRRRRPLTAAALVAVAALWLASGLDSPPLIAPADAPAYEGQEVRVEGAVADLTVRPDGRATVRLQQAGHGIEVYLESAGDLQEGAWIEVHGRLYRFDGRLVMEAAHARINLPEGPHVPLAALAAEPASWMDRPVTVRGSFAGSSVHDAGHTLAVQGYRGEGPTEARGVLQYEDVCLCYVLHVHEARPWSPQ